MWDIFLAAAIAAALVVLGEINGDQLRGHDGWPIAAKIAAASASAAIAVAIMKMIVTAIVLG